MGGRYRQKRGRTLKEEMMMLSVSDVNRSGYIVNRYSRLAVRARPCLSCSGTDKWNIFRGLNQRKMGFHLLAYPLCRPHREMIACRSSSPCLFLSHSRRTWPLNPAEVTKREFISRVLQKDRGTRRRTESRSFCNGLI